MSPQELGPLADQGRWRHWFLRTAATLAISIGILLASLLWPSSGWSPVVAGIALGALAMVLAYLWLFDQPFKEETSASETWTQSRQIFRGLSLIAAVGAIVFVVVERIWVSAIGVPDVWTYVILLIVLVSGLVLWVSLRVLFRPPREGKGLLGALRFTETNVVVHINPQRMKEFGLERIQHQRYERAKAWTIDAGGNLTVWTADAAKATYPAGSWSLVKRMTEGDAVKVTEKSQTEPENQSSYRSPSPFPEN